MATVNCIFDGFEWKLGSEEWPGAWSTKTSANSATSDEAPVQIVVGSWAPDGVRREFKGVVEFGPIDYDPGTSLSSFSLLINPQGNFRDVNYNIRGLLDSKTRCGTNTLPTNQRLTQAIKFSNFQNVAGYADTDWSPSSPPILIDVTQQAQEMINDPSFERGDSFSFVLDFDYREGITGYFRFYATEAFFGSGISSEIVSTFESTGGTFITRVNTNNRIKAGDENILITGGGFNGLQTLRLINDEEEEFQVITSFSDTEIRFDYDGGITTGESIQLEIRVDDEFTFFPIAIDPEVTTGFTEEQGSLNSQQDGFEWVLDGGSFPGTFANTSGDGSNSGFTKTSIITGVYGSPRSNAIATMQLGPLDLPKDAFFSKFNLLLKVSSAFSFLDMTINAVKDTAKILGPSELPSSQVLTDSSVSVNTKDWAGYVLDGFWGPASNPKIIDIRTIVNELIRSDDWVQGRSITLVFNYDLSQSDPRGVLNLWSTETIATSASSINYSVVTSPFIDTISNDDVVELGELDVTIFGTNLAGATNLRITKGGISEPQVIKIKNNTTITFDLVNGAIVEGTGYTASINIGDQVISKTFNVVEGGGVSAAIANVLLDGMEYNDSFPVSSGTVVDNAAGNPETLNDWGADTLFIGPYGTSFNYAFLEIGPINANKGQGFSKADLILRFAPGVNYKSTLIDIQGVKDTTQTDLSQSNKPTNGDLTAAKVTLDTSTLAGFNEFGYWDPADTAVDITPIMDELVLQLGWAKGQKMQLLISYQDIGGGGGWTGLVSNEDEVNQQSTFDYATDSGANIANINGGNIIRHKQKDITIFGNALTGASNLRITQGSLFQEQTIKTSSSTQVLFDFVRGPLSYGDATLTMDVSGSNETYLVKVLPEETADYVVIGEDYTGDNSLIFEANPEFSIGDQIQYNKTSKNGFPVSVNTKGVPTISGGSGADCFIASSWAAGGFWYDDQEIEFDPVNYFARNSVPTSYFEIEGITSTGADITDGTGGDGGGDTGGGDNGSGGDNGGGDGTGGGTDPVDPVDPPAPPVDTGNRTPEVWIIQDDRDPREGWNSEH